MPIRKCQGSSQQSPAPPRKPPLPTVAGRQDHCAATPQVSNTPKPVSGFPDVMAHPAYTFNFQNSGGQLDATMSVGARAGHPPGPEGARLRQNCADPRVGFIGFERPTPRLGFRDCLVDKLTPAHPPQHGPHRTGANELDVRLRFQEPLETTIREVGRAIAMSEARCQLRSHLHGRSAERIGGLEGMFILHVPATAGAHTNTHAELPVRRHRWNLDLATTGCSGFHRHAAACGAPGPAKAHLAPRQSSAAELREECSFTRIPRRTAGGPTGITSILSHSDEVLSSTARARLMFSRISWAEAVQTNDFGWSLCPSMKS